MEVTFHEVRAQLGVETQRQWAERAILRTTPALMGLFSVVALLAHEHLTFLGQKAPPFRAGDAWPLARRRALVVIHSAQFFCTLPTNACFGGSTS